VSSPPSRPPFTLVSSSKTLSSAVVMSLADMELQKLVTQEEEETDATNCGNLDEDEREDVFILVREREKNPSQVRRGVSRCSAAKESAVDSARSAFFSLYRLTSSGPIVLPPRSPLSNLTSGRWRKKKPFTLFQLAGPLLRSLSRVTQPSSSTLSGSAISTQLPFKCLQPGANPGNVRQRNGGRRLRRQRVALRCPSMERVCAGLCIQFGPQAKKWRCYDKQPRRRVLSSHNGHCANERPQ